MEKVQYFCLDISGSMGSDDVSLAVEMVQIRSKRGDFFLMFDSEVYGPWPVEDALGKIYGDPNDMISTLCSKRVVGRGGFDTREVLQTVHLHQQHNRIYGGKLVLLSDGFMPEENIKVFDEFVKIHVVQSAT